MADPGSNFLTENENEKDFYKKMIERFNDFNLQYSNSNINEKELFQLQGIAYLHKTISETLSKTNNEPIIDDEKIIQLMGSPLFIQGMLASNVIDILYTLISPEMKGLVKGVYKKESTNKYLYFLKSKLNEYSFKVLDQSSIMSTKFMDEIKKKDFKNVDTIDINLLKKESDRRI